MKTWMRQRGDRVRITTGKYAGHQGTVESNVYQRTVDYPDEWKAAYLEGMQVAMDYRAGCQLEDHRRETWPPQRGSSSCFR